MSSLTGIQGLGKDDFMKLLVTQLKFQDPLNPMENTEFISQLAQFSTLEGITNMGDSLGTITSYIQSLNNYNAAGLIGKKVKAYGNVVVFDGKETAELSYNLKDNASKVVVNIYSHGKLIRTIEEHNKPAGVNTLLWDGRDSDGRLLPSGEYTFSVSATTKDGSNIVSETIEQGVVDGVVYENGIPYLLVNNSKVSMNNVLEVLR